MMQNFCNCMKCLGTNECEFLREPFKSLNLHHSGTILVQILMFIFKHHSDLIMFRVKCFKLK